MLNSKSVTATVEGGGDKFGSVKIFVFGCPLNFLVLGGGDNINGSTNQYYINMPSVI